MNSTPLADGTYSYTRPTMGPRDATVTVHVLAGQITEGTYNGEPMTGSCWRACTVADLQNLDFTFIPAAQPIGKARASRLHRLLSRLGLGNTDHYRIASAALGRMVDSLAALTEMDARQVWNHAHQIYSTYRHNAA